MSTSFPPAVERQVGEFAETFAGYASALSPAEARKAMAALFDRIAAECANRDAAASRAVADFARKPTPVPPEVIAEALRTFDEAEILAGMREIQNGGGRTSEEVAAAIRKAAAEVGVILPE